MKNESITRYFVRQLEKEGYTERSRARPKSESACAALRRTLEYYGGALPASVFAHGWKYLPSHAGPPSKHLKPRSLKAAGVQSVSFGDAIRLRKHDLPAGAKIALANGSLHDKAAGKDMIYYLEEENLGAFVANNVIETGRTYRIKV